MFTPDLSDLGFVVELAVCEEHSRELERGLPFYFEDEQNVLRVGEDRPLEAVSWGLRDSVGGSLLTLQLGLDGKSRESVEILVPSDRRAALLALLNPPPKPEHPDEG